MSGRLSVSGVPLLPGVSELVKFSVPGGTRANLRYMSTMTVWDDEITENEKLLLADAQTSGGLLIAVSPNKLDALLEGFAKRGVATAAVIGAVTSGAAGKIFIRRE